LKKIKFVLLGILILVSQSAQLLFAMGARPNADPNAPPPPAWVQFFPFVVMIAVFYMLLIRPQSKQRGERQKMMDALKKGDKIVTQGGLIGTIVSLNPQTVEIKLNEETRVRILKSAVTEIWTENAESKDQAPTASS